MGLLREIFIITIQTSLGNVQNFFFHLFYFNTMIQDGFKTDKTGMIKPCRCKSWWASEQNEEGEAAIDLLRTPDPTDGGTGPKVLRPSRTVKYGGDNRKDRFFKKLREIFGILRGLFDRNGQERL